MVFAAMTVAERVFRAQVEDGLFRSGVARGKWRVESIAWPVTMIAVAAAARPGAPAFFLLRFDLTDFPSTPPTAQLWDDTEGHRLSDRSWPLGKDHVERAFTRNWEGGAAIYLPCDRRGLAAHPEWSSVHAELAWTPQRHISFYLDIVHGLLNSADYHGLAN